MKLQRVATVLEVKGIDGFDQAKASQDFLSRTKSALRGLQKEFKGGALSWYPTAKKISELASSLGFEIEGATLERVRIIARRLKVDVQSLLPEQTLVASLITSITDRANELANICKESSEISVGRDEVHPKARAKSQILNAATEMQGVTDFRIVPVSRSDSYRAEKQAHVV